MGVKGTHIPIKSFIEALTKDVTNGTRRIAGAAQAAAQRRYGDDAMAKNRQPVDCS
jgi:hypothetical protein